jgi:hypothetical protein
MHTIWIMHIIHIIGTCAGSSMDLSCTLRTQEENSCSNTRPE